MSKTRTLSLTLIRHGQTPGNAERRYVGSADDQPLSALGREQARAAGMFSQISHVYVSCLRRSAETASIMFPNAQQTVVPGVQEMDFGIFTGRTADEMADDDAYRAWVDSYCEGTCPKGESKTQFNERIRTAMKAFLQVAAARGERELYLVAHGGTMMAFLGGFADDPRDYYEWLVDNCRGWKMQVALSGDALTLSNIQPFPAK